MSPSPDSNPLGISTSSACSPKLSTPTALDHSFDPLRSSSSLAAALDGTTKRSVRSRAGSSVYTNNAAPMKINTNPLRAHSSTSPLDLEECSAYATPLSSVSPKQLPFPAAGFAGLESHNLPSLNATQLKGFVDSVDHNTQMMRHALHSQQEHEFVMRFKELLKIVNSTQQYMTKNNIQIDLSDVPAAVDAVSTSRQSVSPTRVTVPSQRMPSSSLSSPTRTASSSAFSGVPPPPHGVFSQPAATAVPDSISSDILDSRKRCASSVEGSRVPKALKREKPQDILIPPPPSPSQMVFVEPATLGPGPTHHPVSFGTGLRQSHPTPLSGSSSSTAFPPFTFTAGGNVLSTSLEEGEQDCTSSASVLTPWSELSSPVTRTDEHNPLVPTIKSEHAPGELTTHYNSSPDEHAMSHKMFSGVPSPESSPDGSDPEEYPSGPSRQPPLRRLQSADAATERPVTHSHIVSAHGNEIPPEFRGEVDKIFLSYLEKVCSDLDCRDSKGDAIHQALMLKKMQRLDESMDYRPFKFRIQAFTNGFLEELASRGYPEDKIPMKKVRCYLWTTPYISRFNEEGKKAKSKGNHVWTVCARREGSGWAFRRFERKLAGIPPTIAYIGVPWNFTPRIWDPQANKSNHDIHYHSPDLPSWLRWHGPELKGIPPPDAQSCDFIVEARFTQDGVEHLLQQSVPITVAPVTSGDMNFTPTRRPSLSKERRAASDSVVPMVMSALSSLPSSLPAPPPPQALVAAPDPQIAQVLTIAAQQVMEDAQTEVINGGDPTPLFQQSRVLSMTADVVQDSAPSLASGILAETGRKLVAQAAQQAKEVVTAQYISAGIIADGTVTVQDVSTMAKVAVAEAVSINGPLSSEVQVMMTASSLLQQQQQQPSVYTPVAATGMQPNTMQMAISTDSQPSQMDFTHAVPPEPLSGSHLGAFPLPETSHLMSGLQFGL